MFLSKLSVSRPVLTTMIVAALVVLGVFGYLRLSVELMPNVDFPVVTVTTIYPGAGPEEIESQITKPIEDAVSTLADIDELTSTSMESYSFVIIRFELEADGDLAATEVRAKVDAVLNSLPDGVDKPIVQKFEMGSFPIISLAVTGAGGVNETYRIADKTIRDRLSQASGVANVEIIGGQEREIQVAADPAKLDFYGLPISALTQAIVMENLNIPEGRIVEPEEEYTIRTVGQFESLDEIRQLRVPLPAGGYVRVEDLAEVRDTYEEARSLARFNGREAVQVNVIKQPGANTITTADQIYRAVDQLREELPGLSIEYANDSSNFIRDAVADVLQNIVIGILLTALLLFVFLRNWRGTLVAAVVMPSAIVATFLLMDQANFTLNIVSLLALGISVGVLVTNAIVVLENILRHLQMGEDPKEAARRGTDEVALAVLASVLTNVVVFVPIAFMEGIIGRFFIQFGLTVVFSTIFSLVISFTLTPMLSSVVLRRLDAGAVRKKTRMERFMENLASGYRDLLDWSMRRKRHFLLLGLVTAAFLVLSVVLLGISGGEFMPRMDQSQIFVTMDLPSGSSLAKTRAAVVDLEEVLAREPEVVSVLSTVGGSSRGTHQASLQVNLLPKGDRDMSAYEFATSLRPKMAGIPGAEIRVTDDQDASGEATGDLVIEVRGNDKDALERLSGEVEAILRDTPGLVDVSCSHEPGARELTFRPDREELARRGLNTATLAMLLRNNYEGDESSVYREGGEEHSIRVQLADEHRRNARSLEALRLALGPEALPLNQLGEISKSRGDAEILRTDRQGRITLTANIAEGTISEKVAEISARTGQLDIPAGHRVVFGGMYEIQQKSFASLFQALFLAIILVYIVLAMILESFVHPITVMVTLPLALIGSAMGLFFGGSTINVNSLMAMVMLVGIVVNNAILLLDYVGQLRAKGMDVKEALLEACPVRLRPVIMTNLAIAAGMLPQVVGTGAAVEIRITMAVVTIGGVLVSAAFTLILIPALYYRVERIMARAQGRA